METSTPKKSKVIVVSNRLPVTVKCSDDGNFSIEKSVGGLATGLQTLVDQQSCVWVGWPGKLSSLSTEKQEKIFQDLEKQQLVAISLSDSQVKNFYEDYCNGVIWPLFHSLTGELPLVFSGYEDYVKVNQLFAEKVASLYQEGDIVWVHDTHLMMMPSFLRALKPHAKIGFFLHIPFPPPEIFRILPQKEAILQGLLAADLLGFHTSSYLQHFSLSLLRVLGLATLVDTVTFQYRKVKLGVFPMGIDFEKFETIAKQPETNELALQYRNGSNCAVFLGIDRLDYTKGLPRRLQAFEKFLENHPEFLGKIKLIQVAVPSRIEVEAYKDYRKKVENLVARIQGKFATPYWSPIHYMFRSFQSHEIVALYQAADVMLVTPVRDGMNLVAKEYVASRVSNSGILVLSEFAGATTELGAFALQVNPYDIKQFSNVFEEALKMSLQEQELRMTEMRKIVQNSTIYDWTETFLGTLEEEEVMHHFDPISPQQLISLVQKQHSLSHTRKKSGEFSFLVRNQVISSVKMKKPLILCLDYDGTLVEFDADPMKAVPTTQVISVLKELAKTPNVSVHIVSGRKRDTLQAWLGEISVNLHAEHGAYSKFVGQTQWLKNLNEQEISNDNKFWRESLLKLFKEYSKNTPGTFVEEKEFTIAWHYRRATDADFADNQANELKLRLILYAHAPIHVLHGNKVIEVCPVGMNKGLAIRRIQNYIGKGQEPVYMAIGDDQTDEFMFGSLPENSISVHVGTTKASSAKYRLENVSAVVDLLQNLVEHFHKN